MPPYASWAREQKGKNEAKRLGALTVIGTPGHLDPYYYRQLANEATPVA